MKKNSFQTIAGSILVLSVAIFFLTLHPVSSEARFEAFRVRTGDGLREIAARLEAKDLIRSRVSFSIFSLFSGQGTRLRPGLYQLGPHLNSAQIVRRLSEGPTDIKVIIIEGETARDIDRELAEAGIVLFGEFFAIAEPFEGLLFPDTYRLSPEFEPEEILVTFLENFSVRTGELLPNIPAAIERIIGCLKDKNQTKADFPSCAPNLFLTKNDYERIVIGSLVEKEVPHKSDRSIVAGIIDNRLRINMPIQVDITIIYDKCGKTFYNCLPPKRSDFQSDSPYNSYTRSGLPPTPVSNPGVEAIQAAIQPQASKYLYYLSDPVSKQTFFSETFEEHDEKRSQYLR